ncbi:MAG: HEAT repeat domain-containing protein [Coriobacteriia bacterium]|nr:HEAT repeat domain-containing protein [Coriobacteriia bacterium]
MATLRSLVAEFESNDLEARSRAAVELGDVRARFGIHVLLSALFDEDPRLSRWVATTLGLRGDPRALQPLMDHLRSDDATLREAAAGALGLLGHADAIEALADALDDPEARVVRAAAFSLRRLGDDRGAAAVHVGLVEQLHDGDEDQRGFAARTLGALGDVRASSPLVEALADPSDDVRADAAEALGKIADKGAMEPLLERGFRDSSQLVRDAAMFALARMSGPQPATVG